MVRMAWPPFPADFLPTVALGLEVKGFGKGLHRESAGGRQTVKEQVLLLLWRRQGQVPSWNSDAGPPQLCSALLPHLLF